MDCKNCYHPRKTKTLWFHHFFKFNFCSMIGSLLRAAGQRILLSNPHHGVLGSRLCKLMVGRVCFHSVTRNRFICTRCFKELSVTKEITLLPAKRLKMFPGLMWGVSRRFAVTRVGSKRHSASSMRNKTTAIYIIALAVTVVGASYLSVPLYRLYCQVSEFDLQSWPQATSTFTSLLSPPISALHFNLLFFVCVAVEKRFQNKKNLS